MWPERKAGPSGKRLWGRCHGARAACGAGPAARNAVSPADSRPVLAGPGVPGAAGAQAVTTCSSHVRSCAVQSERPPRLPLTGKTACVARGDGAVVSRATVVGGGRDRGGPGSRLRGSVWPEACGGRGRGCLRALGRPAGASLQPPASVAPPRCAFNPLLGQLVEFLKKHESKGPLSCDTILKIFYQVCRAVQHMHRQKPPIIHRDLKVPPPGGRAPRAPRGPGALPVREAAAASTLEPLTSLCSSSPEPGGRFR